MSSKNKTNVVLVVGVVVLVLLLILWLTWADLLGDTDVAAFITPAYMSHLMTLPM